MSEQYMGALGNQASSGLMGSQANALRGPQAEPSIMSQANSVAERSAAMAERLSALLDRLTGRDSKPSPSHPGGITPIHIALNIAGGGLEAAHKLISELEARLF